MSRKKSPRRHVGARTAAAAAPPPAARDRFWLLFPVLWLGVLLAYHPVWHGGVLWDDVGHLTRVDLQPIGGLWRIWFEVGATQQYYPAAHSAFWLLHRLWGDSTLGYHLVNITLHATSAFLIAVLLRRLAVPGAILAAAIFAWHPVQVESVAWMSELKNVLSGVCYLSAALAYLDFDERRDAKSYGLALAWFVAAVFSKSVAATLPAALLVVFWWKRGRLNVSRDVRPLVPLFAIGIAAGLVTAWFEHALIGARGSDFDLTVIERILVAGRVIWFYLGALVWPVHLMFIYPRWTVSQTVWWQYLFPVGVAVALSMLWRARARSRAPLAAALLFCGTLGPALGFINVYPFRFSFVADHFQYLASIPMIALFSAAAVTLLSRAATVGRSVFAEPVLAVVLGLPLAVLTWTQSRQYADADTLWLATLSNNPECWMCHDNLAVTRLHGTDRDMADGIAHIHASLQLNSNNPEAHYNLGAANARLGHFESAVSEFREALRLRPAFAPALLELGVALNTLDRPTDAEVQFRQALAMPLTPEYLALAHYNLGLALVATGRADEARREFEETLRITPDSAVAHDELGELLLEKGDASQALAHMTEAVRRAPASAEAHATLGTLLRELHRPDEALTQYREAARLVPESAEYHNDLGGMLLETDRLTEAAAEFREALRRKPDAAMVHQNLGATLAAMGRLEEAAAESRAALALQANYPEARETLDDVMRRMQRR